MASELPTHPRLDDDDIEDRGGEDAEPLLGAPGDVSVQQPPDKPMPYNLVTGTAMVAQAGILILAATVWAAMLNRELILFTWHPLANSLALLFGVEAILVVQPTHTPAQKRNGAIVHGTCNLLAFLFFGIGLVVIEFNKGTNPPHPRFSSPHAILGLVTYILLVFQTFLGFTMYWVPALYGGIDEAKVIWKYHRMSGYTVILLCLATVCAATQTEFNLNALGIELWVIIVASVLIVAGIVPRMRLKKFGIQQHK